MNSKAFLLLFIALNSLNANFTYTPPYNGGNQFKTLYTNPALLNSMLDEINGATALSTQCNEIPGVGPPILSIKKVIQDIDTSLDSTNANTYAKVIFFKETQNTSNFTTTYKIAVQIRTFHTTNYLGVEGIYRQVGFPTFEITSYLFDSNLENIRIVLNDFSIVDTGYFGCGDIKSIYSQANPVLPSPNTVINGQQSNPSQEPYAQGNRIINAAPGNTTSPDPAVIAEIVKLLSSGA